MRLSNKTILRRKYKMNGGNWKMKCVDDCYNKNNFTINKVYDVKDGKVFDDNGNQIT